MDLCTVDGCEKTTKGGGRGWCRNHYMRWYNRGGDPGSTLASGARKQEPVERLMRHVSVSSDGCWLWTGALAGGGYGKGWSNGRTVLAHRWAYQLLVGAVPEGLELDHLCRVRRCVNPEHLEPVTASVNVLRSTGPAVAGRHNAIKTHCPQGHPYDEANTYISPSGGRSCRTCSAARSAARWRAKRDRA